MFQAYDAILGVDIGGTNIRAGVVNLNLKKDPNLAKAKVWKFALWRHGDEEGVKRDHALDTLIGMLEGLIAAARKKGMKLAPFIGIGCPGMIEEDGSIDRARRICRAIGKQPVQPAADIAHGNSQDRGA